MGVKVQVAHGSTCFCIFDIWRALTHNNLNTDGLKPLAVPRSFIYVILVVLEQIEDVHVPSLLTAAYFWHLDGVESYLLFTYFNKASPMRQNYHVAYYLSSIFLNKSCLTPSLTKRKNYSLNT